MDISEKIRLRRGRQPLVACAEKVGIPAGTWSNWEAGRRRPAFDEVSAICRAIHTDPNDLFGWPSALDENARRLAVIYMSLPENMREVVMSGAITLSEYNSSLQNTVAEPAGNGD